MRTKYHENFDLVLEGLDAFIYEVQDWIDYNFPTTSGEIGGPKLNKDELVRCLNIIKPYVYEREFSYAETDTLISQSPTTQEPFLNSPKHLGHSIARLYDVFNFILPQLRRAHYLMHSKGEILAFANFVMYAYTMHRLDHMEASPFYTSNDPYIYKQKTGEFFFVDSELATLAKIKVSSIQDFIKKEKTVKGNYKLSPIHTKTMSTVYSEAYTDKHFKKEDVDDVNNLLIGRIASGVRSYYTYFDTMKWLCLRKQYTPTQFKHATIHIPSQEELHSQLKNIDSTFLKEFKSQLDTFLPPGFYNLYLKNEAKISLSQTLLLDYALYQSLNNNEDYRPLEAIFSL